VTERRSYLSEPSNQCTNKHSRPHRKATHALRKQVKDDTRKGFNEWKRGFWASRSQILIFPIKKRPNCRGKFFGEVLTAYLAAPGYRSR
jgi:hypothetical protein